MRTIKQICWQDHITNAILCEQTQKPPASVYLAKHRLCWFGYLLHLPSDHPTQAIYHFDPLAASLRGPRGALHTHWIAVVKCDLDWHGLEPNQAKKTAHNCRHWHSVVDLVGSMPQHED